MLKMETENLRHLRTRNRMISFFLFFYHARSCSNLDSNYGIGIFLDLLFNLLLLLILLGVMEQRERWRRWNCPRLLPFLMGRRFLMHVDEWRLAVLMLFCWLIPVLCFLGFLLIRCVSIFVLMLCMMRCLNVVDLCCMCLWSGCCY